MGNCNNLNVEHVTGEGMASTPLEAFQKGLTIAIQLGRHYCFSQGLNCPDGHQCGFVTTGLVNADHQYDAATEEHTVRVTISGNCECTQIGI